MKPDQKARDIVAMLHRRQRDCRRQYLKTLDELSKAKLDGRKSEIDRKEHLVSVAWSEENEAHNAAELAARILYFGTTEIPK